MKIKIEDIRDIHKGFTLKLDPGYTVLVGPNGAGKTTLLGQIKEYAQENDIDVWEYSNLKDGGDMARDRYLISGNIRHLATSVVSSEGQNVMLSFSSVVGKLGKAVQAAASHKKALVALVDGIDSGLSIDTLQTVRDFFENVLKDCESTGLECYLVVAANAYELVKSPADCVDVRTGKHKKFASYTRYETWICSYSLDNTN